MENIAASQARVCVMIVKMVLCSQMKVGTGASVALADNTREIKPFSLAAAVGGDARNASIVFAPTVLRVLSLHLQLEALTSAPSVERASMESTKGLPLTTLVLTVPRVRRMLWKDKTSASTVLLEPRLDRQVW